MVRADNAADAKSGEMAVCVGVPVADGSVLSTKYVVSWKVANGGLMWKACVVGRSSFAAAGHVLNGGNLTNEECVRRAAIGELDSRS